MPRFALTTLLAAASLAMATATAVDAPATAGNDRNLRGRDFPAELQQHLDNHHDMIEPHFNAKLDSYSIHDFIRTEECHPGWGVGCQDNPLYRTRLGLDCSMHVVVDCEDMTKIGFTEADMDELILNCPCSCNVEW